VSRFAAGKARSEQFFGFLQDDVFFERPLPLRHPIVFYRGHLAAFAVNTLLKKALGRPGIRPDFEILFERGIDPSDRNAAEEMSISSWPPRGEIEEYVREAGRLLTVAYEEIESGEVPDEKLAREAAQLCIEHEQMHQETLLYIFHRVPPERKIPPDRAPKQTYGPAPRPEVVRIPAGRASLGALRGEIPFGWDNEFPRLTVQVPAFEIDRYDVTNGEYLEFLEAGGYRQEELWSPEDWEWRVKERIEHPLYWKKDGQRWNWRAMFEEVELPMSWPVYVSQAEASAFARWRRRRLPTEPEYHRAAFGESGGGERPFPWGEEPPDSTRGNFDLFRCDPVPVGYFPAGASAWGVDDMLGNGWEWTSTVFSGFPGFQPMFLYPVYSADFFDGRHFVMKGGSPATATDLLRRSFRNWFQAHYPYPYATFRCARSID
jgi:ergothioneine biosynthesis protein EgtB